MKSYQVNWNIKYKTSGIIVKINKPINEKVKPKLWAYLTKNKIINVNLVLHPNNWNITKLVGNIQHKNDRIIS